MLQPVRRPVLVAAAAGVALVAQHARPHDVGARVVVLGLGQHARRLGAHGLHQRQVEVVGDGDGTQIVEEALEQMREHVGDARRRLVLRQRERELGIQKRQLGALRIVAVAGLHPQLVVADDGVLGGLAARRGDGEHHGDGKHVGVGALGDEQLPHILLDARAVGDRLGRVDDAAAAHGEDPVDALLLAQRNALAHQADLGIGAHAAQLDMLDARRIQRRLHAVDEPAFDRAGAAEMQQHPLRAALGELGAHLLLGAAAEHEMGRRNEFEVLHGAHPSRSPDTIRFPKV